MPISVLRLGSPRKPNEGLWLARRFAALGRFELEDYESRLKREIAMIQAMGFPSYFLIDVQHTSTT